MSATHHSSPITHDSLNPTFPNYDLDSDPVLIAARKAKTDAMIAAIKDSAANSPNLRRAREAADRERRAADPLSRGERVGVRAERGVPPRSDATSPTVPTSDIPAPTFYDKTTPEVRDRLRRAILDRQTCRKLMELHKLASKGVSYDALCRFARQVKTEARVLELAELLTPNPQEIPDLLQRLAGVECIDALLHAEEEGSAKKLARNMKHYLRLRDQDLKKHIAEQREATKVKCATIRREGQKECTELRTSALRDCSQLRAETQRYTTDTRDRLQRDLTKQRLDHQHDTVQFKADCAAALHNARYPAATDNGSNPPLSQPLHDHRERTQYPSPSPMPQASSHFSPERVICSNRNPHIEPGAPATGFFDNNSASIGAPINRYYRLNHNANLPASDNERSEPSHSDLSNPESEFPPSLCPPPRPRPFCSLPPTLPPQNPKPPRPRPLVIRTHHASGGRVS